MGYIGSISHGTELEKAVYARALGTVLRLGDGVREMNGWYASLTRWLR